LTVSSDKAEPPALKPSGLTPPAPPVALWNNDKVPVVDPETALLRLTEPPAPPKFPPMPPAPPVAEADTLTSPLPD
jgi:hypothetical protein